MTRATYTTDQILDLCLEIVKQDDTTSMNNLLEILSEERQLYSLGQWSFISNILNQANATLCCA